MSFGERLRALRLEKKLTLRELAKELDISFSALGKYERNEHQPDFDTLEKLADYFDVSIDYLLGRTEKQNLTIEEQDETDFQAFINNPTLQKWYKELPKSREEDLEKLRKMWEILKNSEEL